MTVINTYWIRDEPTGEWTQFQPQTVFALARMRVVNFVETETREVGTMTIKGHRYERTRDV